MLEMKPDFNHELADYPQRSSLLAEMISHTLKEAEAKPGSKEAQVCESTARAVFESIVIFLTLCPKQTAGILRQPIKDQIHDFHSPQSKAFAAKALKGGSESLGKWASSASMVFATRSGFMPKLEAEIGQLNARHKALLEAKSIQKTLAPSKSAARKPKTSSSAKGL